MNVKNIPIEKIKPYSNNPRKNEKAIPEVVKSLKAFGWQQPLVVDQKMVIIVGHTRYAAAIALGYTEVPVIVAKELSPQQVKAYRIMDNKTGELATWDKEILLEEIVQLETNEALFDSDFLGFNPIQTGEEEEKEEEENQGEFSFLVKGPIAKRAKIVKMVEKANCQIIDE